MKFNFKLDKNDFEENSSIRDLVDDILFENKDVIRDIIKSKVNKLQIKSVAEDVVREIIQRILYRELNPKIEEWTRKMTHLLEYVEKVNRNQDYLLLQIEKLKKER